MTNSNHYSYVCHCTTTDSAEQACRDQREDSLCHQILTGVDGKESIYNCYTGIGGLHDLKQSDFANYHKYAEAKKEFEMG